MTLSRVLGAVGRTLITSGCMVLLFVAYQLWGTGIQAGNHQNNLASDFTQILEDVEVEPEVEPVEILVENDETGEEIIVEPTPTPVSKEFLEQLYPSDGGVPIARIVMEDIDVDQVIVSGVGVEDLKKGPGHYGSTVQPGQPGNAAIAGHRTTYGAPFHRIDELQPGDEIKVQTLQGLFTYEVIDQGGGIGHQIVTPDGTHVLDDFGDNRLTLTACHPKYSARQRIIVFAKLVGEPVERLPFPEDYEAPEEALAAEDVDGDAPAGDDSGQTINDVADGATAEVAADVAATTDSDTEGDTAGDTAGDTESDEPTDAVLASDLDDATPAASSGGGGLSSLEAGNDDFGEGLSGDREAIMPSITWALAAAAIWVSGRFIGGRTKRLPVYAAAFVPFAAVLWTSFVFIDRALPSY